MKKDNARIVTDDFTLRPWEKEDAERLAFIANNKKIADNLRDGFPYPYSIDDARKFIHHAKHSEGISKAFAIIINGFVAGSIAAYFKENLNLYTKRYVQKYCSLAVLLVGMSVNLSIREKKDLQAFA